MTFSFKPRNAGIRTLTLDGGGVRGILELQLLKHLEAHVGFDIPVQQLFDLVIGTSSGAIIALSLFKQKWKISQAIQKFESLVTQAFTKRFWNRVPVISWFGSILFSYRYESKWIDNALQLAFGSENSTMLYGPQIGEQDSVKIGAVATSNDAAPKMCLLSNYLRDWNLGSLTSVSKLSQKPLSEDYLRREATSEDEMLTWEVARASSAAPTYFQEFRHRPTSRAYADGGLQYNNPIAVAEWERRLIWPEHADRAPDIVISVGSGIKKPSATRMEMFKDVLYDWVPRGILMSLKTLLNMKEAALDCERKWQEVRNFALGVPDLHLRYHRLNVLLENEPCELDDVGAMRSLIKETDEFVKPGCSLSYHSGRFNNCNEQLAYLAEDLISKLFYFDVTSLESILNSDGAFTVRGQLRCRLDTSYKRQFRRLLKGEAKGTCLFRIRDNEQNVLSLHVQEQEWDFERFLVSISFTIPDRHMLVYLETKFDFRVRWMPISGFPRVLEGTLSVDST